MQHVARVGHGKPGVAIHPNVERRMSHLLEPLDDETIATRAVDSHRIAGVSAGMIEVDES